MTIECPACGFSAAIDPARLSEKVKSAVCPRCRHRFPLQSRPPAPGGVSCPWCGLRQQPAAACRKCLRPLRQRPPGSLRSEGARPSPRPRAGSQFAIGRIFVGLVLVGLVLGVGFFLLSGRERQPVIKAAPPAAPPPGLQIAQADELVVEERPATFRAVAVGARHTAVVRNDGALWLWGNNESGQLGLGTLDQGVRVPTPLTSIGNFRAVAAGHGHTLGLTVDGTVWGWGDNRRGQVGCDSEQDQVLRPTAVSGLDRVVELAAGESHSVALKEDGTVWVWGDNLSNQLGNHGIGRMARTPQQVPLLTDVVAVAAGRFHSLALDRSGSVYIWGGTFPGLPGQGNSVRRSAPVRIPDLPAAAAIAAGELESVALAADGAVWQLTAKLAFSDREKSALSIEELRAAALQITPRRIEGLTAVRDVAAGDYSFLALKEDGTVWGWGTNGRGELASFGVKKSEVPVQIVRYRQRTAPVTAADTLPLGEIVSVAAGASTAFALDRAGTLWSWGSNYYGQRGIAAGFEPVYPWPVSDRTGVTTPGNVVLATSGGGASRPGAVDLATLRPDRQVLAGGYEHSLFVDDDKQVWGWGNNEANQLGLYLGGLCKTPTPAKLEEAGPVVEVAASYHHSLALARSGAIWIWGRNPNDGGEKPSPRKVMENVRAIAAGRNFFLALDYNGDVFSWGGRFDGRRRDPREERRTFEPGQVPYLTDIVHVAAGYGHALALDAKGQVFAWGDNRFGQLGTGSNLGREEPVPVAGLDDVVDIAAGRTVSLALRRDGTVWAWGEGLATDYGGSLRLSSPTPVPMSGLDHVVAIACGGLVSENLGHNLALKDDGTVWAWGNNQFGQLGDGTSGNLRTAPVQVAELDGVVAIAAGDKHSLALRADGRLVGWGNNMDYQVGVKGGLVSIPQLIEGF